MYFRKGNYLIMDNKKLLTIVEGAITIVLGVLIAVFGTRTLDLYFGILFVIGAAFFLTIALVSLIKTKLLPFGSLLAFSALLTFGVVLLLGQLSFGFVVYLIVLFVIAAGGALALYGIYTLIADNLVYGIGQIVLGGLAITMGILYLTVPEFHVAFWIIVGVLVAVYGVLVIVSAFTGKKSK